MDLGTAVGAIQMLYQGEGVQQARADLQSLQASGVQTGASMVAAGAGITALGAGAVKFIGDAVGIAADVQAGLKSVEAATGATDEQIQQLDQTIGTLGKDTVFSAGEITDAADTMAKAGIGVEDQVGGALKTVTDLAAATGESLTTAAGTTADAMATFNLSGEQVVQVADLTTQAVNASKIGLAEYNAGFRNLAPTMSAFADNSEEAIELLGDTGQVIAFFTSQGLKGADAGISFSRMIQNLATPTTQKYADAISEAGINLFDMEGNFVGAEEAIRQVNKAFAGLTDQQIIEKLDQLGIGAEALDVVTNIASKGNQFPEFVADMESGATAAEAAGIRMEGLSGAIEALTGSVQEAMRQMGTGLLAPIEAVVRAVTELVNAFLLLPQPVQQAIGVFIGVAGALTTALGAIIGFAGAAKILGAVLGPLFAEGGLLSFTSMGAIAAGIGIVAAAAAALFLAYKTNFLGFGDLVDNTISSAKKAIDDFGLSLTNTFSKRKAGGFNDVAAGVMAFGQAMDFAFGTDWSDDFFRLGTAAQAFGDAMQENATNNVPMLVSVLDAAGAALDQLGFTEAGAAMQNAALAAQKFGDTFANAMKINSKEFTTGLAAGIMSVGDALSTVTGIDFSGSFGAIAKAIDTVAAAVSAAADAIRDKLSQAFDFLRSNVLPGAISALGNVLGTIKDIGAELLGGDFSQAGQILGDAIGKVGEWAGNVVQGLGDAIGSVDWGNVVSTIGTGLVSALQGLGSFLGGIDLSGVVGAVGQALSGAFSAIGNFLGAVATIVANAITGALSGVANFITGTDFGGILQKISDLLVQAFNTGGEWLGTVAATVGSALTNAMQSVGNFLGGVSFNDIVSKVGGLAESAFNAIGTFLSGIPSTVGGAIGTALSTVGNFLGSLNFGNMVSSVVNAIISAFGGGGGGGGSAPSPGLGAGGVAGAFSPVAQSIGSQLTNALNGISQFLTGFNPSTFVTDIVTKIQDAFDTGGTFDLSAMGENLKSALEDACGIDLSTVFDTLGDAVTTASTALGDFAAYLGGHIDTIKGVLEGVDFSGVFSTLRGAIAAVQSALSTLSSEIGSRISAVQSALADFSIPGAFSAFGSLITTISSRLSTLASDVGTKIGEIQTALETFSPPDWLGTLASTFGTIATKAGEAAAQIGEFLAALGGGAKDAAGNAIAAGGGIKDQIATLGPIIDDAVNGLFGNSDQALAAMGQQGDFATNFINAIAQSFASADWSPVQTAMQTALDNVMSGSFAGQGGPRDVGPSQGSGLGTTLAAQMVTDIAAGFTPEAFAPIKTAFDAGMTAAMAGAGEGGGGADTGAAQQIGTNFITQVASGFGQGVATLKSALQAVLLSVGQGITGLETIGQTVLTQIASGFGPATGAVTAALNAVITTVIAAGNAAAAAAQTIGTALLTAFGQGIGAATGTAVAAVQAMVATVIAAGDAAAAAAQSIGAALATAAGQGIGGATSTFTAAVEAMVAAAIDAGIGAAAGASAIGAAVSAGAASGVILDAMNSAVAQMVSNGIAAGMAAADAASPSRVAMEELGEPISQGAAIGVDNEAPLMADAVTGLVDGAVAAGQKAIDNARALFEKWGLDWGGTMAAGATESMPAVESAVADPLAAAGDAANTAGCEIPSQVASGITDCAPEATQAATDMATGVGDAATTGLDAAAPVVEDAATDVGAGAVDGLETGITENADGAVDVSKEAGTTVTEGMATGIEETAPQVTDSMTTMVDDAMSAADAALQAAQELFAQHGMTFGNAVTDNAAAAIDGSAGKVTDAATKMAEQIRAAVEERVAGIRERAADLSGMGNILGGRNDWAAKLQSRQEMSLDVTLEIGGEPLDRHIRQVSISPLAEAIERVGSRFGDSF